MANLFENIAGNLLESYGPEVYNDILNELRTGAELEQARVSSEVCSWSEVNTQRTSRGQPGLGYVDMEVPSEVYFDWVTHEGAGFWKDRASKQWFLNKNPQFKVRYEAKAQHAWTPAMDRTGGGLYLASARTTLNTMRTAA